MTRFAKMVNDSSLAAHKKPQIWSLAARKKPRLHGLICPKTLFLFFMFSQIFVVKVIGFLTKSIDARLDNYKVDHTNTELRVWVMNTSES